MRVNGQLFSQPLCPWTRRPQCPMNCWLCMGPQSVSVLQLAVNIFLGCPAGILVAYLYRLTYSISIDVSKLTPRSKVFKQLQLIKKFPAFYGTRRPSSIFARVRKFSLSWVRPIQSTLFQPIYLNHPSTTLSSKWLFFPHQNLFEHLCCPLNPSAWSDGHCPHAARSHSFVYISTS